MSVTSTGAEMIQELLAKPLRELTRADLDRLIGATESEDLEFNGPLPWKERSSVEPWEDGRQRLADYTRDGIVKEVVAFANAGGGTYFLGIDDDASTGVATGLHPLPDPSSLAERLHQIFDTMIDPRLPNIQVWPIETEPEKGVVAIRVQQSWLRPHKHTVYGHCFARRGTRADRLSMRELRDMIYLSDRGIADIDRRFKAQSDTLNPKRNAARSVFACRMTAQPLVALVARAIDRKFMRDLPLDSGKATRRNGARHELHSNLILGQPRPGVRAWTAGTSFSLDTTQIRVEEAGLIDITWLTAIEPGESRATIYAGWLLAQLRAVLSTIDLFRQRAASLAVQYLLEIETVVPVDGVYSLAELVDDRQRLRPTHEDFDLKSEVFARYVVGHPDTFNEVANLFYVDLLNSAGIEHPGLPIAIEGFPVVATSSARVA